MKKSNHVLIAFAVLAASFFASKYSLAKTEGNQIGIALNRSKTSNYYEFRGTRDADYPTFSQVKYGASLDYKYAFNFNDFFVAPGVFFDQIGSQAKDIGGDSVGIKMRYGAKLDLGYDLHENVALYLTGGIANNQYEVKFYPSGRVLDWQSSAIYGVGVNIYANKNVAINFEYNLQKLQDLKTPDKNYIAQTKLSVMKLGVAYRF